MQNNETIKNDKRKLTSRLNALKSTGPKTTEGSLVGFGRDKFGRQFGRDKDLGSLFGL